MTTAEQLLMSIEDKIMELNEEEQAKLAAMVLNEIDPNRTNLDVFFDELDDIVHDELCNRAEDQEIRL